MCYYKVFFTRNTPLATKWHKEDQIPSFIEKGQKISKKSTKYQIIKKYKNLNEFVTDNFCDFLKG